LYQIDLLNFKFVSNRSFKDLFDANLNLKGRG
jgi:hypothetical protein